MKTCRPQLLPIRDLEWRSLVHLIGDAREALARFDEALRKEKNAPHILEPMRWQESMSSLRSKKFKADFIEVLWFKAAKLSKENREPLLQKIIAAQDALTAAIRWERRKKIGPPFYCRMHALIKPAGSVVKDIGRIRSRQNWIGFDGCKIEEAYFYPPAPNRIRPLLRNLDAYLLKKDIDPLIQIAIGFAQFLIIHPFMDGNGRVARLLVPILAKKKKLLCLPALFLSEYFEAHRLEYFQKLFRISEKNQWEEWIAFFLKGVISQTNRNHKRFGRLQNLWNVVAKMGNEQTARMLFHQPLILKNRIDQKQIKEKFLIAQGVEFDLFEPLIRAMRID
jgi:hypothetical protein